jgi:Tol biopolymer transport system component
MDGNGENPRRILTATAPDKLYPMSWSPDGGRVWFVRVHWEKEQQSITLETCDRQGASRTVVLPEASATAFRLLPPGRLIYAAAEAPQNFTNLWELPVDSVLGKPVGPPRKLTNWTNFSIYGISATADGKQVALLNGRWQADVYVGDLRAGGTELANTRRLTLDESDDYPAFWTPDGQSVVFSSNRNGKFQVSASASTRPSRNCSAWMRKMPCIPGSAARGSTSARYRPAKPCPGTSLCLCAAYR